LAKKGQHLLKNLQHMLTGVKLALNNSTPVSLTLTGPPESVRAAEERVKELFTVPMGQVDVKIDASGDKGVFGTVLDKFWSGLVKGVKDLSVGDVCRCTVATTDKGLLFTVVPTSTVQPSTAAKQNGHGGRGGGAAGTH
jgi:hypothetical protein